MNHTGNRAVFIGIRGKESISAILIICGVHETWQTLPVGRGGTLHVLCLLVATVWTVGKATNGKTILGATVSCESSAHLISSQMRWSGLSIAPCVGRVCALVLWAMPCVPVRGEVSSTTRSSCAASAFPAMLSL